MDGVIRFNILRWLVFIAGAPAAFSPIGQLWIEKLVWMHDYANHYLPSAPFVVDPADKRIIGYVVDGELVEA